MVLRGGCRFIRVCLDEGELYLCSLYLAKLQTFFSKLLKSKRVESGSKIDKNWKRNVCVFLRAAAGEFSVLMCNVICV